MSTLHTPYRSWLEVERRNSEESTYYDMETGSRIELSEEERELEGRAADGISDVEVYSSIFSDLRRALGTNQLFPKSVVAFADGTAAISFSAHYEVEGTRLPRFEDNLYVFRPGCKPVSLPQRATVGRLDYFSSIPNTIFSHTDGLVDRWDLEKNERTCSTLVNWAHGNAAAKLSWMERLVGVAAYNQLSFYNPRTGKTQMSHAIAGLNRSTERLIGHNIGSTSDYGFAVGFGRMYFDGSPFLSGIYLMDIRKMETPSSALVFGSHWRVGHFSADGNGSIVAQLNGWGPPPFPSHVVCYDITSHPVTRWEESKAWSDRIGAFSDPVSARYEFMEQDTRIQFMSRRVKELGGIPAALLIV